MLHQDSSTICSPGSVSSVFYLFGNERRSTVQETHKGVLRRLSSNDASKNASLFDGLYTLISTDPDVCNDILEYKNISKVALVSRLAELALVLMQKALVRDAEAPFCELCKAIVNMSMCPKFRANVCKDEFITIFVHALREFQKNTATTETILRAVRAVIGGNDGGKTTFNNEGGVHIVAAIMQQFKDEESLAEISCKVLDSAASGQLAETSSLLKGRANAVKAMKSIMETHPKNALLQESACSFLIKVASISDGEARTLVEEGFFDLVMDCQDRHQGNAGVELLANQLVVLLNDNNRSNWRGGSQRKIERSSTYRFRARTIERGSRVRVRARKTRSFIR